MSIVILSMNTIILIFIYKSNVFDIYEKSPFLLPINLFTWILLFKSKSQYITNENISNNIIQFGPLGKYLI